MHKQPLLPAPSTIKYMSRQVYELASIKHELASIKLLQAMQQLVERGWLLRTPPCALHWACNGAAQQLALAVCTTRSSPGTPMDDKSGTPQCWKGQQGFGCCRPSANCISTGRS
jgi:hypothetical protein